MRWMKRWVERVSWILVSRKRHSIIIEINTELEIDTCDYLLILQTSRRSLHEP
jgi:hypothetical protein